MLCPPTALPAGDPMGDPGRVPGPVAGVPAPALGRRRDIGLQGVKPNQAKSESDTELLLDFAFCCQCLF